MNADAIRLPPDWTVEWCTVLPLTAANRLPVGLAALPEGHTSVAMAFWEQGLTPWGREVFPLGHMRIALLEFPNLDDVWTLWMWCWREQGRELPPQWRAMCQYVADVRQGFSSDRVPPAKSIQAVYITLANELLAGDSVDRERFLAEALALCRLIGSRLEEGADLLADPICASDPMFARYVQLLERDQVLYAEDKTRGKIYWATIPAEHAGLPQARRLPLLVLRHPLSRQFKIWARADSQSPSGHGFPLLLVAREGKHFVISSDPGIRAQIGWLAAGLSEREGERRGDDQHVWYDGSRHGHNLAASPPEGSVLSFEDVLAHLTRGLRLKRVRKDRLPKRLMAVVAGVVALVVIALIVSHGSETPEDSTKGSKGEPLSPRQMSSLIDDLTATEASRHYALIAGVCGYPKDRELEFPCNDARALREMLIAHYGYQPQNIIYLVDDSLSAAASTGRPTAREMRYRIESLGRHLEALPDSQGHLTTFLLYYSGHGGFWLSLSGNRNWDTGVLQPADFFENEDALLANLHAQNAQPEGPLPMALADRGWLMDRIIDDLRKTLPSRHILVVLDACYSGWATGRKGEGQLSTFVTTLWNRKAEIILTAGASNQEAWEDPVWDRHGAFTYSVLRGLDPTISGGPLADQNKDGVVTAEELFKHTRKEVQVEVSTKKRSKQEPQYFRFNEDQEHDGQFLFVPQTPRSGVE